jgi:hypothetical protein
MVRKKRALYSRKVKGWEQEGGRERLAEVTREVNDTRQRLRKAYFKQKLEEMLGDSRAT